MTPEQVALVKHLTNRMSTTLSALDTVSDAAFVGPPADPRTPHGAFEAVEAPGITLSKYLRGVMASTYRLGVHDAATAGAVAIALIRRLAESGEVPFTPLTAHRLGLTCFIVAQKVHCDTTIANKVAARIGGVELDDLNACERAAIQVLGWKIVVDLSEVHSTMDAICARPNIPLQRTIPY